MMDVEGGVPGGGDEEFVRAAVDERFHAGGVGGEDSLGAGLEIESGRRREEGLVSW